MDNLIRRNLSEIRSDADFYANGLILKAVEDTDEALELPPGYSRVVSTQKSFDADTTKMGDWQVTLECQDDESSEWSDASSSSSDDPGSRNTGNRVTIRDNRADHNSVLIIGGASSIPYETSFSRIREG